MSLSIRKLATIPCFQYCYSQVLRFCVSGTSQSSLSLSVSPDVPYSWLQITAGVCRGKDMEEAVCRRMYVLGREEEPIFLAYLSILSSSPYVFQGWNWTFMSLCIASLSEIPRMQADQGGYWRTCLLLYMRYNFFSIQSRVCWCLLFPA